MTVRTPIQTANAAQSIIAYTNNIDADFSVSTRLAWLFAPHEQSSPDMTVRVDPGHIFDGTSLTEVGTQNTTTITAPTSDSRIDRVVIDRTTGAVSVVTGAEAASPSAPAIPAGKLPVAQVLLQTSSAAITNGMITDERDLTSLGLPAAPRMAFHHTQQTTTDSISDANDGLSAPQLTGMSKTIAPLSATSTLVVLVQGNMTYSAAARGESSAWLTYEVSGSSETLLQRAGPMGTEDVSIRPKQAWSLLGFLQVSGTASITFRVRANARDVLNNAASVEWFGARMVIQEIAL